MVTDLFLTKQAIIERCLGRIREVSRKDPALGDMDHLDSVVLNLQRACEASIDLAMGVVAEKKAGLPQTSKDAFELLRQKGLLSDAVADRMKKMVGFRNIAVHDYQVLSLEILKSILADHLSDFELLIRELRR